MAARIIIKHIFSNRQVNCVQFSRSLFTTQNAGHLGQNSHYGSRLELRTRYSNEPTIYRPPLVVLRSQPFASTSAAQSDKDSDRQVYVGTLTKQVKIVKGFSISTSAFGLLMQPYLYQSAGTLPTVLTFAVGGMLGVFIFLTPLLLHFITKRYVTQIKFNDDTGEFTASTLTFLLRTKSHRFTAKDITPFEVPRIFATVMANGTPLFIDPSLFTDRQVGVHLLRYDEPIDWEIPSESSKTTDKKH